MSGENSDGGTVDPNAGGEGTTINKIDYEKVTKEREDFKKDMLRYKDDLASKNAELSRLHDEVKGFKLSDEEKKGNYEDVIQTLKSEIGDLKKRNQDKDFKFATSSLDGSIKAEAIAQGCDPERLSDFMLTLDAKRKGLVTLDEGYRADRDEVKEFVSETLKQKHWYLKKDKVKVADLTPSEKNANASAKDNKPKSEREILENYMKSKKWT